MPEAHSILWFLASFLGLWGLTLIARGVAGERTGKGRQCPMCRKPLAPGSFACGVCGYEARGERAVRSRKRSWPMAGAGFGVEVLAVIAYLLGHGVYVWTHQNPDAVPGVTLWECAACGTAVFSAALIAWAVVGDRSRGRRRCPECWYDMTGSVGLRCPECGREAAHTRELYKARRRLRRLPIGLVGLLLAAGLWEYPRYKAGGVTGLVPTTALIAGCWSLSDQFIMHDRGAAEDWSLLRRLQESKLASWQLSWLASKVRVVLNDPPSPEAYTRAFSLRQGWYIPGSQWQDDDRRTPSRAAAAFARWLASDDASLRFRAAGAYGLVQWRGEYGVDPQELRTLAPGLRAALSDTRFGVALSAAHVLAGLPSEYEHLRGAVPAIVRTGGAVFSGLGAVVFKRMVDGGDGEAVRAVVDRALTSTNTVDRQFAIVVLEQVLPNDAASDAAIRARLNDPDDNVAVLAFSAVRHQPGDPAPPELIAALKARKNPATRQQMLAHLWSWTVSPSDMAGLLAADPDPSVQLSIISLIEQRATVGGDVIPALEALKAAAKSDDAEVAKSAGALLDGIAKRKNSQDAK